MQNIDQILNHIEQNLKADVSGEELAVMAGYSLWHFCRLFAQTTGRTLAAHIAKRRIDTALQELSHGKKAIDVALEYGFDTYAGFYKAFVRLYGLSPKKYLSLYVIQEDFSMINEKDLRVALTNWDVPQNLEIHHVSQMDGAKIADTIWQIGESYFLKTGQRDRVLRDVRLQKAIGGPIIATKAGDYYLEGKHVFMLTKKIDGMPLDKAMRFGDNRYDYGVKYGYALAHLHKALTQIEIDIMPNEKNLHKEVIQWALPKVAEGLPQVFIDDFKSTFTTLLPKLPKQLIHRDTNPSNILFKDGQFVGFIDFELSERNIRLWDVCYTATGILSEQKGVDSPKEKWFDILSGILHGYNEKSPLSAEEKQAVFYIICAIQLVFIAYCMGIDKPEYKNLVAINKDMLMFIIQSEATIKSLI